MDINNAKVIELLKAIELCGLSGGNYSAESNLKDNSARNEIVFVKMLRQK